MSEDQQPLPESEDQLQPEDSLDDRGVEDLLDEGISPPERPRGVTAKGVTEVDEIEGETLEERLAQEQPEEDADWADERDADILDGPVAGEVGQDRAGRLVAPDQGSGEDTDAELFAEDEGIDGAGASAEEAAVHVVDEQDHDDDAVD